MTADAIQSDSQAKELVKYSFHADLNIHEYIFLEQSRGAVDAWFALLDTLYREATAQGVDEMLILVDVTNAPRQPVTHTMQRAKEINKAHATAPPRKIAFLGTSNSLGALLKPLLAILRQNFKYAYYTEDQRPQAIAWLQE